MTVKIYKIEELNKISKADRQDLLKETLAQLAHQRLRVRTQEDKQSHKVSELKEQAARIETLNSIKPSENEK